MPRRFADSGARGLASTFARLLLVAALICVLVVIDPGVADARRVPVTLADQRPAQVGVVEVDFPIDFVAITWYAMDDQIDAHAHGNGDPESHGAVRFRSDGVWGRWTPFHEDGAQAEGQWSSSLVTGSDAEAYQIRGVPAWAGSATAMAINTTDGPLTTVDSRSRGAADSLSRCVSRAEWGADESYRFVDGVESWPTVFYPVQGLIVHHTVTPNDDTYTGAERIRAIYAQHAVLNDWGDIGYNYLIDEAGLIYEGRWSGTESTACSAAGSGADFAHNDAGELVTGGHTAYHNQGNVGIALLGNFASPAEYPEDPDWVQVDPKPVAAAALSEALVELVKRHDVDPTGMIDYANPMCDLPSDLWEWDCIYEEEFGGYFPGNGDPARFKNAISGHRDWKNTACPGASLYAMLPEIRSDVYSAVHRPWISLSANPLLVEGDTVGGYSGPLSGVVVSDPDGDDVTLTNDAPVVLPLGDTEVTWTATDPGDLSDSVVQTVTVTDTTPPVLTVPKALYVEADVTIEFPVAVADIVDAAPTIHCMPASGSVFAAGSTTVTCEGEDASGNTATAMFEVVAAPIDPFTDDDGSVFEVDIEWMAAVGITKGCNPPINDRYCPDARVTRGQMAAFLVRALDLTARLDDPFTDDDDSIFEADIERLAAAGITKGCNPPLNDRFCPDGKVTREQMAAFLVRALGYTDNGGGDLFTDDDDSIFEGDIDRLGTAGVTKGCNPPTNDRYCPSSNVTRGQMAAFLHRALG